MDNCVRPPVGGVFFQPDMRVDRSNFSISKQALECLKKKIYCWKFAGCCRI